MTRLKMVWYALTARHAFLIVLPAEGTTGPVVRLGVTIHRLEAEVEKWSRS